MRNQIWYELTKMKNGERYLAHYITWLDSVKRWIRIIILFFAGGGIVSWSFWKVGTVIACIVIAVFQILNLIENQFIRSDSEIKDIEKLRNYYLEYCNELERVWIQYERKTISENEAYEKFFDLRTKLWLPLEQLDNQLKVQKKKRLHKKSIKEYHVYLTNKFNQS